MLKYLSSVSHESANYPLYAGKVLVSGGRRFNSGAAGIVLNRAALLRFQLLTDPGPRQRRECFPPHLQNASQARVVIEDNKSFGRVKEPGLILADCLKVSGMGPNRTRDGGPNGTEDKFHGFGPQRLYAGTTDEWYKNYHGGCKNGVGCGKEDIGQRLANGSQCCSSDTISFRTLHVRSFHLTTCCCLTIANFLKNGLPTDYVEDSENLAIYAVLKDQQKFQTAARKTSATSSSEDWRVGFWPRASQLSYSTPPKPHDGMWEFLAKKLHVAPLSVHSCSSA